MTEQNNLDLLRQFLNLTFSRNLEALEKHFPNFYQRFKSYEPKTFGLEMDPKGYLNIFGEGQALYAEDPKVVSAAQYAVFSEAPTRFMYNLAEIDELADGKSEFWHVSFFRKFVQKCNGIIDNSKAEPYESPGYYPMFCAIGCGLGYHLESLIQEDIGHLYLYEPDNDIFYASLFVCNYAGIIEKFTQTNRGLTLDIGSTPHEFADSFHTILFQRGIYRSAVMPFYRHYRSEKTNEALRLFLDNITKYHSGFGFFEDELIATQHTIKNMLNNTPLIQKNINWTPEVLKKPVFIVGNGPSLDLSIDFLKENQNDIYIFSCGSALSPLYKAGITPDLHFEIERTEGLFNWVSVIDDDEYYKKITSVTMNNVSPKVLDLFGKNFIFLKPNDCGTDFFADNFYETYKSCLFPYGANPLVGNGAFAFALYAGLKNIYLTGIDNGFKELEYHHSKSSAYYGKFDGVYDRNELNKLGQIPGNFVEYVYTDPYFDGSRLSMEFLLRKAEFSDVVCHNCSDGAYIEGATPKRIEDVNLADTGKKINLSEVLSENSVIDYFGKDSLIQKMQNEVNHLKGVISHIAGDKLTEAEINFEQLMEILNYQYNLVHAVGDTRTNYAARMLIGSLHYLQTSIVGKLYLANSVSARNELCQYFIEAINEYYSKMMELHQEQVVDWLNEQYES